MVIGVEKLKDVGQRLLDPIIALAVIGLIIQTLASSGILGSLEIDLATKISGYIINILILIGVMKQPNSTK